MTHEKYALKFPNLFRKTIWEWAPMDVEFAHWTELPPAQLIANVNLVPFVGNDCLIIRLENDDWEIPGGTLEPGEDHLQAMTRELVEEAGAIMLTFNLLGAWFCHSHNPKPYRPHRPHPDFYRLVGYGDVEVYGLPSNPADGEQVAQVLTIPVGQAAQHFLDVDRPDLAELYQFAQLIRSKVS